MYSRSLPAVPKRWGSCWSRRASYSMWNKLIVKRIRGASGSSRTPKQFSLEPPIGRAPPARSGCDPPHSAPCRLGGTAATGIAVPEHLYVPGALHRLQPLIVPVSDPASASPHQRPHHPPQSGPPQSDTPRPQQSPLPPQSAPLHQPHPHHPPRQPRARDPLTAVAGSASPASSGGSSHAHPAHIATCESGFTHPWAWEEASGCGPAS